MKSLVFPTQAEAAHAVADAIESLVQMKPDCVLGLAAGRTPAPTYQLLCQRGLVLDHATVVLLDEYVGLGPADPRSFRYEVQRAFTDPMNLDSSRLLTLDGMTSDAASTCLEFEQTIRALGGIDLQLLGLGRNGHIGFNEPGSSHSSRTRLVDLAPTTRAANAQTFGSPEAVPRQALTQGIGTILEARQIMLLATGSHKATAVAASFAGPITTAVPASALQTHGDVTVLLDEAAAADWPSVI